MRLEGCLVLLVEDDPWVGPMLRELFEAEGASVSGPHAAVQAALAALDRVTPSCAILDVELTDGLGYPVAAALTERDIPYAFLSASLPHAVPASLRPFALLHKPASRADLLALVEGLEAAR